MTSDPNGGGVARSRLNSNSRDQTDRILVIGCVVLWLAALGTGVAAVVALVGLARGHTVATGVGSDTPWPLYIVIGVSAAVIICAIPLLVRARRTASSAPARQTSQGGAESAEASSAAQRLQPFGAPVLRRSVTPPATSRVGFPTAAVDQVWLRGTASILAAMGAAATGIGVATYLMASGHDTGSWVSYGVAALLAVAMPVAAWYFLRQLRVVLDSPRD